MIVWHKLMDALLESDPLLAAKRTADIKRYTVRRWQKIHGTPLTHSRSSSISATSRTETSPRNSVCS